MLLGYLQTQEVCWRMIGSVGGVTSVAFAVEKTSKLE